MAALLRIRIVLLLLMVFGSFANFALNEWGNDLIVICQFLMAITFFGQAIYVYRLRIRSNELRKFNLFQLIFILLLFLFLPLLAALTKMDGEAFIKTSVFSLLGFLLLLIIDGIVSNRRKKANLSYANGVYESLSLFVCFLALVFKNMHWPAAGFLLIFGTILMAFPFYLYTGIQTFRYYFKDAKVLGGMLFIGSLSVVIMGISRVFKIMHYPFGSVLVYSGLTLAVIFLIFSLVKKFELKGEKINLLKAFNVRKTQISLVFFLMFVHGSYILMKDFGLAPSYYEPRFPKAVDAMIAARDSKADEVLDAYFQFVDIAEKNGFIK